MKYFIGIAFMLFISCTKKQGDPQQPIQEPEPEKKIDTIKPLPYLPVFPGSYWKYINSKTNTIITYTTSATYEKDSYEDYSTEGDLLRSETAYVPRYNNVTVWGYKGRTGPIYNHNFYAAYSLIPIVDEKLGAAWTTRAVGHEATGGRVIKTDTSIVISGKVYSPTIVVYYISSMLSYTVPSERRYYTKDIGLVKIERLHYAGDSITSEMHLIDYYINR